MIEYLSYMQRLLPGGGLVYCVLDTKVSAKLRISFYNVFWDSSVGGPEVQMWLPGVNAVVPRDARSNMIERTHCSQKFGSHLIVHGRHRFWSLGAVVAAQWIHVH